MKTLKRSGRARRVLTRCLLETLATGVLAAGAAAAEAAVLEVTPVGAETLAEDVGAKAKAVKAVTKVERYLLIKTQPHDIIGLEPGADLRVVVPDGTVVEAKLESGKQLRKEDDGKSVAIIGNKVYAEDYGYRGGTGRMATMKHLLEAGQTFKLTGEAGPRIRVLGTFSAKTESAVEKVFLPLSTAQKLFNRPGQVSHLFVAVEGDPETAVKELQSALGSGVQVRVISR